MIKKTKNQNSNLRNGETVESGRHPNRIINNPNPHSCRNSWPVLMDWKGQAFPSGCVHRGHSTVWRSCASYKTIWRKFINHFNMNSCNP